MTRAGQEAVWRAAGDGLTDAELVRRLAADSREAAFATLVRRHGPLVLGVCRRVLGDVHAAEDAFQATFLVLWQKPPQVDSLAGWLHAVAGRVARKALTRTIRTRARERKAPMSTPTADAVDDVGPILDEEIGRLTPDYRAAVVLCYFEGKTYQEAGRILGWPEGTVSGRLARARDLLRDRLTRRGVTCSAAALGVLLSGLSATAVPPALEAATLGLATSATSPAVAALAAEGSRRLVAAVVLAVTATVGGVAVVSLSAPPDQPAVTAKAPPLDEVRVRHPAAVLAVGVSPRGDRFATAGADEAARLWALDGSLARQLPVPRGVTAAAFSPDGRSLATAGQDGVTRVWNVDSDGVHALPGHDEAASAVAFSPTGGTLASGGWDGRVRLWNVTARTEVAVIDAHRGKCWGVAFSPDGKWLATAGDKEIRLWAADTGRPVRRLDAFKGPGYALAFTDPQHLAVSRDNTVALVRAATGEEVARVGGPQTAVATFAVSPDGRTIAWAGGYRTVHLWEVAARQERLTVALDEDVTALAFAADGGRLIAGGANGQTVAWKLSRLATPLDAAAVSMAWNDLTGSDATKAYRAVESFAAAPDAAVPFLTAKVRPDAARLGQLVAALDAPGFADREAAGRELRTLGPLAESALRKAVAESASVEVRDRAEQLLARLPTADAPPAALSRVLEALERAAARDALQTLATSTPESDFRRQAALAVDRLRLRPSPGVDR